MTQIYCFSEQQRHASTTKRHASVPNLTTRWRRKEVTQARLTMTAGRTHRLRQRTRHHLMTCRCCLAWCSRSSVQSNQTRTQRLKQSHTRVYQTWSYLKYLTSENRSWTTRIVSSLLRKKQICEAFVNLAKSVAWARQPLLISKIKTRLRFRAAPTIDGCLSDGDSNAGVFRHDTCGHKIVMEVCADRIVSSACNAIF